MLLEHRVARRDVEGVSPRDIAGAADGQLALIGRYAGTCGHAQARADASGGWPLRRPSAARHSLRTSRRTFGTTTGALIPAAWLC